MLKESPFTQFRYQYNSSTSEIKNHNLPVKAKPNSSSHSQSQTKVTKSCKSKAKTKPKRQLNYDLTLHNENINPNLILGGKINKSKILNDSLPNSIGKTSKPKSNKAKVQNTRKPLVLYKQLSSFPQRIRSNHISYDHPQESEENIANSQKKSQSQQSQQEESQQPQCDTNILTIQPLFTRPIYQQRYWPDLQEIEEVPADLITTSQRKPKDKSTTEKKSEKQHLLIKSHRDRYTHRYDLGKEYFKNGKGKENEKSKSRERNLRLSNPTNSRRTEQLSNKHSAKQTRPLKLTQKTLLSNNQEAQSHKTYKKPTSLKNFKRKRQESTSLSHLKGKSTVLRTTAELEKEKGSSKSQEKSNQRERSSRSSYATISFERQIPQEQSETFQKRKTKNNPKSNRQLEERTNRAQKGIKMLWDCMGQLWENTRISQYVKNVAI